MAGLPFAERAMIAAAPANQSHASETAMTG